MKYAKLDKDNIVIQIQPNKEKGFIEVEDDVICGMIKTETGFTIPEVVKTIEEIKAMKLLELEQIKDMEQDKSVLVRDLYFFGGRTNGQKYREAYDLALLNGLSSVIIAHTHGFIEVEETYINEILREIGNATYATWYKFKQLESMVNNAKTEIEVESIGWDTI